MRLSLKHRGGWPSLTRLVVVICALLIVGQGILTAFVYTNAQHRVGEQLSSDFGELTSGHVNDLSRRMEMYGDMLYATRGLFAATKVDPTTWETFIHTQSASDRYAGMQTIAYAEIVPNEQIGNYRRTLQTSQYAGAQIHPQNSDSQHVILTYYHEIGQPEPKLLDVLGYDLTSSPERLAAMERAKSSGAMAATSRIDMVPIGNTGFLLVLPLSERFGNQNPNPPVFGYALAAFNIDKLITNTIGPRLDHYQTSLTIKDITDATQPVLIDRQIATPGDSVTRTATMRVGDRTWEMTFKTPKSVLLVPAQRYAPTAALAVGTVFMLATSFLAYTVQLRGKLRESAR